MDQLCFISDSLLEDSGLDVQQSANCNVVIVWQALSCKTLLYPPVLSLHYITLELFRMA